MKQNAPASGIIIREAFVESLDTLGIVEHYHAVLSASFERVKMEYGTAISDRDSLEMSVYSVNAVIGP